MTTCFIIGAAGKVGFHLTKQLSAKQHAVSALHRKPEQAEALKLAGAVPVAGDIQQLTVDQLAQKMAHHEVVIFSAGAGGAGIELTNAIDGEGLALAVDAAEKAHVKRFMLVSAFPDAGRGEKTSERFENYMRVKRLADVRLVESALDWVILRPGTLTDVAGTGRVRADLAIPYGSVPREDVAATLVALVETPQISHKIIELTEGDERISDAMHRLQRD
ncbi:SDR family oxidoreductase [Pantoea allii]|uniref:SDR family oxidoreductase n=1 Tax=Pantoea allii TaxID=574096 RepID=A0ABS6VEW1_9GAMM|nr:MULTISPECIES: SDR family oxidoreductase [Pantoea]MBW1214558.1 SDR family oxidoreductase [Pantoea allii]MBW1257842.1 SDR family oxidoreductase [Pantoea allii]MBW1266966.1 SDR family oxidoreductase [Pantoea allii]MBW1289081.1 SDR family oxidoreductase [Pantoea allii]OAE03928.1 NAD-dependent dehydratase [Pantoea sp. OXWO6B1]